MEGVYQREALLYVGQVDHLAGKSVGQSIDLFYVANAVEEMIVRKLHTGGWHKIQNAYCYLHDKSVTVDTG